jgi:hypothetical protein
MALKHVLVQCLCSLMIYNFQCLPNLFGLIQEPTQITAHTSKQTRHTDHPMKEEICWNIGHPLSM